MALNKSHLNCARFPLFFQFLWLHRRKTTTEERTGGVGREENATIIITTTITATGKEQVMGEQVLTIPEEGLCVWKGGKDRDRVGCWGCILEPCLAVVVLLATRSYASEKEPISEVSATAWREERLDQRTTSSSSSTASLAQSTETEFQGTSPHAIIERITYTYLFAERWRKAGEDWASNIWRTRTATGRKRERQRESVSTKKFASLCNVIPTAAHAANEMKRALLLSSVQFYKILDWHLFLTTDICHADFQ